MINLMSSRVMIATVVTSIVWLFGSSASAVQELPIVDAPQPADLDGSLPVILNEENADPEIDEDLQVLMRGPMHEAFAEAYQADPVPGPLIQKAPPEDISELPPEYKPDGNKVQWIPGYWAWDDSRSEFIWISGVWRDVPPNRQWVAGYWEPSAEGFRWISGFWADESFEEPEYLAPPPPSLESGPSSEPYGENYFYVPGNWEYEFNQYRWRTGHWMRCAPNWIWIPACYIWTPRGCIYRRGYWDFEFVRRGAIFAPICFNRPIYGRPGYCYTPNFVLRIDLGFLAHVFVRRNCNQYYFGNWYGNSSLGYYPWAVPQSHYRHYDPLLTYYNGQRTHDNLNVAIWIRNQQTQFKNHDEIRPPATYSNHYRHLADNQPGHKTGSATRSAIVESYAARVKRSQINTVKLPVDADTKRQAFKQLNEEERKAESLRRQVKRVGNKDRITNLNIAQQQQLAGSGNISEKNRKPLNLLNDGQKQKLQTEFAKDRIRETERNASATQQPGVRHQQTRLEKNVGDAFQTQLERQRNQSVKSPIEVKPKQEHLSLKQNGNPQQKLPNQPQIQQPSEQLRKSQDRQRQQQVQQQIELKQKQEQFGRNQNRQQQQLARQQLQNQKQQPQIQQPSEQLRKSQDRQRQQQVQQQIELKQKQEQFGRNQNRQQQQLARQQLQNQKQQPQIQQPPELLRKSQDRQRQQQIELKQKQEQLRKTQDRQQQPLAQQQLQNKTQQQRKQQQSQQRAEPLRKSQERLRQQSQASQLLQQKQQQQRVEQLRKTQDRQSQQQQTQQRQLQLRQQDQIRKSQDRNGPQQTNRNNSPGPNKSGGGPKKSK